MTIKTPRLVQNVVFAYRFSKFIAAEQKYETMIAESQAKLAETTLVPGYTKIYA
jgi:hypothetical protein